MTETEESRARRILHDTFWSPEGWKPESKRALSTKDFDFAKAKGVMFDPVQMNHEEAVRSVRELVGRLDRRAIVDAFLLRGLHSCKSQSGSSAPLCRYGLSGMLVER